MTPLRTELSCGVPVQEKFTLNIQELRPGHSLGDICLFTALLTHGCWPSGLEVSSHRCVFYLEGTGFPLVGGTPVNEGVAVKLPRKGEIYVLNLKHDRCLSCDRGTRLWPRCSLMDGVWREPAPSCKL